MMDLLQSVPPWVWIALIAFGVIMGTVAYLILLERKIASWVQDRIGPNRVGPGGLLQPMADGLKFFLKEDYRAGGADKILFTVAPALMITVVIVAIAVIPWGGIKGTVATVDITNQIAAGMTPEQAVQTRIAPPNELIGKPQVRTGNGRTIATYTAGWYVQVANLNIGVLFLVAILSLAVYGIVIGGWASNNKYSFLGGLRATAQMISYEIPLALSLLTVVVLFGTLDLNEIVQKQAHLWGGVVPAWNAFAQPLAFVMFLICIHAEANRAPFDLAEAEQELVGGYHTEYSSMRFALFFLAEYAGMIVTSAVCVALFFGGWHLPGLTGDVDPNNPAVTPSLGIVIIRAIVFFTKVVLILSLFMWVRWSLPRFRFDQLMMLAWRALIPISLALLVLTALVVYWMGGPQTGLTVSGPMALVLLAGNMVVLILAMLVSTILPAPPPTNRRLRIADSRFNQTPLPAS